MLNVLVVDDSLVARKRVIKLLEKSACSCSVVGQAVDGVDALEQFETLQPNVVITDIEMPNMDGIELLRTIRKTNVNCFILVVSTLANEQIKQVIQTGKNMSYLQKPLKDKLFELVLLNTENNILNTKG